MRKHPLLIALPLTLFFAACTGGNTTADLNQTNTSGSTLSASGATAADEATARQVVDTFGKKMKNVPLQADSITAAKAMDDNYAGLVMPDLLTAWKSKPALAPGRLTSSPWPERIDIQSITRMDDQTYVVSGNVIEMTSQEAAHGGIAGKESVRIVLVNENGQWLIAAFMKQ